MCEEDMRVIPAVDIKQGQCVRLLQGRMEDETVFGDDPAAMADKWSRMGASLIHVVDLDGAFQQKPINLDSIRKIIQSVGVKIQVGGGIRAIETIRMYFEAGVARVVIGSEAVKNPALVVEACKQFPGRIVVGIDARNGFVAIEGWSRDTETKAIDLARKFEDCGVAAINFTDILRDGMQTGPNIDQTRQLAKSVSVPVVASGGVSSLDDIRKLIPLEKDGVVGIITGRALYSGSLNLKEALALCRAT